MNSASNAPEGHIQSVRLPAPITYLFIHSAEDNNASRRLMSIEINQMSEH